MAIDIPAGTPLATAVQAAQRLLAAGRYEDASAAYQRALIETGEGPTKAALRRALWEEHTGGLLAQEALHEAIGTARRYLEAARQTEDSESEFALLLLLGEALAAQGDWPGCFHVLDEIHGLAQFSHLLGKEHLPALLRLEGLAAFERDDHATAWSLLTRAREGFKAAGEVRATQNVEQDLSMLKLSLAGERTADETPLSTLPESISLVLLAALALRRQGRYEAAAELLTRRLGYDVEPALRFPLLHDLVLLLQILGDQKRVAALLPLLEEAASEAGDPREARAATERIAHFLKGGTAPTGSMGFEGRLHDARALVRDGDLSAAEKSLLELRGQAAFPRFAVYWSIAAGELEWARARRTGNSNAAREALSHLERAARLAEESSLPHLRAESLRLAGRIQSLQFGDARGAADHWTEAARLDEWIASRQQTDEARIRYLEGHPTELDEVIDVTAARVPQEGSRATARVLAALELARGAALLSLVQSPAIAGPRNVPAPEDLQGCWRWCRDLAADLPRNLVLWILHPTPDRLYQALLGKGILRWVAVPMDRREMSSALVELSALWSSKNLESFVQEDPGLLPDRLGRLARWLRLELSLSMLSQNIRRLAVVAGGALAEIPFAALPLPGSASSGFLVNRYALSYLPCLSAERSLRQRSSFSRGDTGLIVRPPAADLTMSLARGFHVLKQDDATPSALESAIATGAFSTVRIDCHGSYAEKDALESWLTLSPENGDDGRLTARRLQSFPLSSCGTLMLGACESGMSQERGRDERIGFARAGLAAGASAVLAARWIAEDRVASAILDAFQRRLLFLPRDEALRRSQLDILQSLPDAAALPIPNPTHPARWACWSLWGDPGLQTSRGWIVRSFRSLLRYQENRR